MRWRLLGSALFLLASFAARGQHRNDPTPPIVPQSPNIGVQAPPMLPRSVIPTDPNPYLPPGDNLQTPSERLPLGDGGNPPTGRLRPNPWAAAMCAYDQNTNPSCLRKSVDDAMRELAGKVFAKVVHAVIKRLTSNYNHVLKFDFTDPLKQQREAKELEERIRQFEKKALEDLEAIMRRDLAALTPLDWTPERTRAAVEQTIEKAVAEIEPRIESGARGNGYQPKDIYKPGPARRQLEGVDNKKAWQNQ